MRTLLQTIQALMDIKPVLLGIDGPCGGGKSTLARELRDFFIDAQVYHMDDFFLPPGMRTAQRLAIPGENVHYERFLSEVLLPMLERQPFAYHAYDCRADILIPREGTPARLHIVEGSYSLHPALREYYDLKVFLDIDEQAQARRIIHREGEAGATAFLRRWIPLENAYFAQERLRDIADILINA